MMNSLSELLIIILIINYGGASSHHGESSSFFSDLVNREKRQVGGRCILPEFPENGKWSVLNGHKIPGESVPASTSLRFECFQGYKLSSPAYIVCDKNWSGPFPECLKTCPALYSTRTTILTCFHEDGYKVSCSEATSGTQLTYQCIDNDIYEVILRRKIIYCEDGDWSHPKPECQPVCGKRNVNAKPLSFNTEDTKLYEFPWVTAIFLKINSSWWNNCGGTLITPRIVLTAAHCVSQGGKALPKEEVVIAVGKQYLDYGDSRDLKAQYRKLSSIVLNGEYKAERRYQYDIALLVATTSFILGPEVQPVCYDELPLPPVASVGEIAGWGITEEGIQPDHLKTLTIFHKDQTGCANELPSEFVNKYYLHDKMCGGFFHQNKSLCKGDSGSGLVFLNPDDNRYYVHGIVSIAPQSNDGACNSQDNTLLTKVSVYHRWIERQSTIIERCTLPPYPLNGKWELQNGIDKSPGQTVQISTILVFSCDPGYILDSVDSKYYCASARFPTCEKLCPVLHFTIDATNECVDGTNRKILCFDAAEGAAMKFICPRKNGGQQSGTIRCNDGNWTGPQPDCVMETLQGTPMGVSGTTCELGPDGDVIICNCLPGYVGNRCQQCAPGYIGNPEIPGGSCRRLFEAAVCDPEGSLNTTKDSNGMCKCKDLVDGPQCNQCKAGSFYLSRKNQFGCIPCFCMGLTNQCSSSTWFRDQVKSEFVSMQGFKIVENSNRDALITEGIKLDQRNREISYSQFVSQDVYYWALPSHYLGNKMTSYGGSLTYTIRYTSSPGGQSSRNDDAADVELVSRYDLTLLFYNRNQSQITNASQTFVVPILEQEWQRTDGQQADREHLLMALSDLEAIYIKASYFKNTMESSLISVSLDIASERNTGSLQRALEVEQCHCPKKYTSLSCDTCHVGYTRASDGLFLGHCKKCRCNGYSNDCDPETGVCINCRDGTTGRFCNKCLPGYEGNPAKGVPCRYREVG